MITVDYTSYCEGQKDWAERLSRHAADRDMPELLLAAVHALARIQIMTVRPDVALDRRDG